MGDFAHFSRYPGLWEELTQMLRGSHNICPPYHDSRWEMWLRALSPIPCRVWGDTEKLQHEMAYLFIALGKTVEGKMVFWLVMVWAHPHQACLSSLDEAVRKLALLINIGDNWVYTFVQLNEGTLHVPLSNEGHISTMINGTQSSNACRCVSIGSVEAPAMQGSSSVPKKAQTGV